MVGCHPSGVDLHSEDDYGVGVFDSEGVGLTPVVYPLEDMLTISDLDPSARRVRLSLSGDVDIATVPGAFARIIDSQPGPGDVVTLDTSEVTFIDSTGLSMLLKVSENLEGMGCRLVLANPSAPVMRLLTIVGCAEHFAFEHMDGD